MSIILAKPERDNQINGILFRPGAGLFTAA
jgi:hypothetical protein